MTRNLNINFENTVNSTKNSPLQPKYMRCERMLTGKVIFLKKFYIFSLEKFLIRNIVLILYNFQTRYH